MAFTKSFGRRLLNASFDQARLLTYSVCPSLLSIIFSTSNLGFKDISTGAILHIQPLKIWIQSNPEYEFMTGNKKLSTLNWSQVLSAKLLTVTLMIVPKMRPNTCFFPTNISLQDPHAKARNIGILASRH